MSLSRLAAVTLAFVMTAGAAHAGGTIDFGTAELGQIETACLTVCFGNSCSGAGTISSIAVDPPFFVRGLRSASALGANPCSTGGISTPENLPVNLSANELLAVDVDLIPLTLGNYLDTIEVNGQPVFDTTVNVQPVSGCFPSTSALCLQDDRFKTRVHWRTDFGTRGGGTVVSGVSSDDSGLFYFFNPDNWEMLIKVIDGCGPTDRFWVFAAATTNVEYTITVVDTQDQEAVGYFKPQGPAAPAITDTSAFATCP